MSARSKKIWFRSYLDSLLLHDIRELMDVRAFQVFLNPDYSLSQFRDKQKREIDFLVTADDGSMLGIEVKAGSDVGKSDFRHLAWFRDNMVHDSAFTGIVLYTGATTLPFGKNSIQKGQQL